MALGATSPSSRRLTVKSESPASIELVHSVTVRRPNRNPVPVPCPEGGNPGRSGPAGHLLLGQGARETWRTRQNALPAWSPSPLHPVYCWATGQRIPKLHPRWRCGRSSKVSRFLRIRATHLAL